MNQFKTYKILQMTVLAALAVLSLIMLMRPSVKHFVFTTSPATTLFILVWVVLIAGFVFVLIDFSMLAKIKKGDHTLYGAAYSDQVSGMPNRFSCDTVIEKYADSDLPEDVGCVMIDFSNLADINKEYGHKAGNESIREFSKILQTAAQSLCFVGRNGGNKFLAVFERCTKQDIYKFTNRLSERVTAHNANQGTVPIEFNMGAAYNGDEKINDITQLISLANRRIKPLDRSR